MRRNLREIRFVALLFLMLSICLSHGVTEHPFWANQIIEHAVMPWKCMNEFYRVLRPGGFAFVAVPSSIEIHANKYPDNYRYFPTGLQYGPQELNREIHMLGRV